MRIFIRLIILLIIFTVSEVKSQNRWVKVYHDETDAPMKYIVESYDKGYLLSGKHGANYSKYNWLIKTDINGEILWEKTIGDGIHTITMIEMVQNNEGAIYLCGGSRYVDPIGDPLIIKLDSCGEKEWCKIFYTQDNHDYSQSICLTPDQGCAVTLRYTNP
ncbi:MAG: hypothetical protein IMY70_02685, partial [Bacteroidetes bacterium]|nr:hypothetical protein [Bacteroidota bacterium]